MQKYNFYLRSQQPAAAHPHFVRLSCLRHFKAAAVVEIFASQNINKFMKLSVQARSCLNLLIHANKNFCFTY